MKVTEMGKIISVEAEHDDVYITCSIEGKLSLYVARGATLVIEDGVVSIKDLGAINNENIQAWVRDKLILAE